jgi:hypothetical protein
MAVARFINVDPRFVALVSEVPYSSWEALGLLSAPTTSLAAMLV